MKICKLLLFLLPLCLLLTACNDEKSSSKPVSEIVTVPVTTKPLDTSKAENCVITAREETFTCTDKNKNTVETVYRIPALTFDTPDAVAINSEINKKYEGDFAAAKEASGKNKYTPYDSINYEVFLNDAVISILITSENTGHNLSYSVYNYNKTTGKRLDNKGLLSYLQRDYGQTFAKLKKALEDDYTSKFKYENFPKDYYNQMELTVGDEAVAQSQLYLNGDADLYAVCVEHAGVGSGEFSVLISLV